MSQDLFETLMESAPGVGGVEGLQLKMLAGRLQGRPASMWSRCQGLDTLLFSLVATWKQSVDLRLPEFSEKTHSRLSPGSLSPRVEAPASPGSCPQRERRWSEPRARLLLPVVREFESFQQERGLEDFLVDDLDAWRQQGFFYECQQNQNCHQLISQDDANFRLEESLHVGKQ